MIGVRGIVIKAEKTMNIFLLGCEDTCYFMPIQYRGQFPNVKSKVTVYGNIKKQGGEKYIFQAREIKAQ